MAKTASQRGKSSRNKGGNAEREFRLMLIDELGDIVDDISRNLQQTDQGGADFLCVPGWTVECKYRPSSGDYRPSWMDEAIEKCVTGTRPALAFRRKNQPESRRWMIEVEAGAILEDFRGTETGKERLFLPFRLWAAIVRTEIITERKQFKTYLDIGGKGNESRYTKSNFREISNRRRFKRKPN